MLLLPAPASAVLVGISGISSDPYSKGSEVEFQIEITLQDLDSYVPISNFSLDITGPESYTKIFNTDGIVIPLDPLNISIEGVKVPNSTHFGSGLGEGYDADVSHTFGYGDGYGSDYGSGGGMMTFIYNVTLNTTIYAAGEYKVTTSLNTGNYTKPSFTSSESTFTIAEINNVPVASDDIYSVNEGSSLNVPVTGVLANDDDVDGDTLSAELVGVSSNGDMSLNPDGSFTYTPFANFNGVDSFTYKANDGILDSNVTTVSITVNANPVDTSQPTVSITSPSDGATIIMKSNVTVTATAADNVGVVKIEFYVNGDYKYIDTSESYAYDWYVPTSANKEYTLEVKAYDAEGNVGNSTITVTSRPNNNNINNNNI